MSTFGRPNAFGSASGTTGFGSINQQPQNNLFGNSTAGFGTTNTTNNLFGQQQTTTPSLFGNAVTTQPQSSVFGNSTANTGFATSNTLFSGTGTMSNSQNLFGANKFGTSSTNLFGSNTSTGLTAFSSIPSVVGTTIKFNPFLSSDTMVKNGNNQNINTRHQCITCMKEYESKSLEELRYEDYQAGRKGTTTSPMFGTSNTQTGGLFTTNPSTSVVPFNSGNTSSSIFSTNKPAFGATTTTATTSIFNTTFNKSFGTSGSTFGTTQSQPIQPTQTSIFGATNPAATTGFNQNNIFNISSQNNSTSTTVKPFFTATTAPTNSMFQSTSTTNNALSTAKPFFGTNTSTFGAPTSSSSFTFNPTTQAASTTTNSLFSTNQGSSLFSMNPATNTQTKSMFNFPSQTTTLNSQSTLNTTNPTGSSLFNTSGLGTTTLGTTSNLFGTMNNTSTSLFGTTNNTSTTLGMNQNTNQGGMLSLQQISSPNNQNNNNLLMNRLQSLPYGSSSLFQNKVGTPSSSLKFTTDPKILNQYKVTFTSSSNSQIQKTPTNTIKNTSLLFDGLDDDNPDDKKTAFNIFVPRKNIKKLTIKPKDNSTLSTLTEDTVNIQTKNSAQTDFTLKLPLNSKQICDTTANVDSTVLEYFRQPPKAYSSTPAASNSASLTVQSPAQSVILEKSQVNNRNNQLILNSPETSVNVTLNDSQNYSILGHNSGDCASPVANATFSVPKCKVILNRTEYFTIPPLEQLDVDNNTCVVESFTVGRHGYGSIFWEGPLDIFGINLDECVHIRRKEVFVYPDDENKPIEGSGLNRPAQITLHKVWPIDKTTHEVIKDPLRLMKMNYSEKIENATIKFGGIFKEYRPDSGTWVFKVKHFSKYGLIEEDEEDESVPMQVIESSKKENIEFDHRQNINYYPYKEDFEKMKSSSKNEILPFNRNTDYNEFLNLGNSSKQYNDENFDQQNISQKSYSNNRHFLNFEDDEENEEFENENMDNFDYPEEIPVANTYNYLLRNILFENEEKNVLEQNYEQTSKKKKTLIKNDFLVDRDEYFNRENSFNFIQPKIKHKSDIILKPDSYPAENKIFYDISSLKCSGSPKVRFMHGFNNLILANGRNVNVFDLKLINENVNLCDRFDLQMNRNSELFLSSEKAPFIQVKPTIENKHNPDKLEKLVKALYGNLDIENEHEYVQARTNRIIDWLTEQNKKLIKPTNLFERIIYYLSTNDIKNAIDDLILANHPKLAILISSGNNFAFKNNICQQLLEWKTLQGDLFISKDLLKIYVLLSGETTYRLSNNFLIDVLDNLTWTQQLSLLLLYSVNNSLEESINNMTCETNDVEYHLIANHNPLVAMSSAESDLEAWFLHQSLKSYGIIDSETNSDVIHGLLSSQLMAKNIRWACYVACHITHDLLREYTLTEILFNYVQKMTQEDEDWLKKNLRLHTKYIASVKAQFAKSNFDVVTHGEELLECEEWVEAHDVLVESIFPELVINEEFEKLRDLIDKLKPYKEIIPNWYTSGAHLFNIYVQCVYSEAFDEELMNEPFNFSLLKCKNHRQRLCQSEMARKINLIYHEFNKERFLLKTPVPSDYALKELRFNSRSILKELCS